LLTLLSLLPQMNELFVELQKYRLYFDGTVEAHDPEKTHELLLLGLPPNSISTKAITDDIKQHNQLVDEIIDKIQLSKQNEEIGASFTPALYQIPQEYFDIDLADFVNKKLQDIPMNATNMKQAQDRVDRELAEIAKRKIELLFKTIIYVVDIFNKNNIVYGVGRGSSCACYILYLLGLNLVNPLKYNIPVEEFFH
jgi:DNA polymerase III alpha subunit